MSNFNISFSLGPRVHTTNLHTNSSFMVHPHHSEMRFLQLLAITWAAALTSFGRDIRVRSLCFFCAARYVMASMVLQTVEPG